MPGGAFYVAYVAYVIYVAYVSDVRAFLKLSGLPARRLAIANMARKPFLSKICFGSVLQRH